MTVYLLLDLDFAWMDVVAVCATPEAAMKVRPAQWNPGPNDNGQVTWWTDNDLNLRIEAHEVVQ